jgi:hypothetical protein
MGRTVTKVMNDELGISRVSPAGKFMDVLGWVNNRFPKVLGACKTEDQRSFMSETIGTHITYLHLNRKRIVELLNTPRGSKFNTTFKEVYKELDKKIIIDCFEKSKKTYVGKRRPIDMFYKELSELYRLAMSTTTLYNDDTQQESFKGIVIDRLRYMKSVEEEVLKVYEGR